MFSGLAVTWVTLFIIGQCCMLLLLATYLLVKDLPGRHNVFLLNFLLTTFLITIPPLLLWVRYLWKLKGTHHKWIWHSFYGGQQDGVPPHWLCLTQSILMDGIAPMWEFLTSFFNSGAGLQYWSNDLGRPGLGWLSLCLFFRYVFTVNSQRIRRVFTFLTRRHGRSCAVLFVAKDLWWQLLESRDGRWVKYSLGHSRRNLYYGRQLLLLPYITLVCWCTGSIVVSLLPLK